jgi:ABC-type glycerol-3-phosphate transport system permease component
MNAVARAIRWVRHTRLNRSKWGDFLIFVSLFVLGCFFALPFYLAIINSIKPLEELFLYPPRFYVTRPVLDNYFLLGQVVQSLWVPFSRYLFNSVFVSVVATTSHLLLASMAAFSLAKFRFPGSLVLFNMVVLALLFTPEVTFLPRYIVMAKLKMINTYWALILPWIAAPLGLFLMKQFMMQIPDSLIESAMMDGAKMPTIYWRIAMPNVKPAYLTAILLVFQAIWNNPATGLVFNEELKLMPVALRQIAGAGIGRAGVSAAARVIMILPPVLTFVIVQSNVLQTMAHSGIK